MTPTPAMQNAAHDLVMLHCPKPCSQPLFGAVVQILLVAHDPNIFPESSQRLREAAAVVISEAGMSEADELLTAQAAGAAINELYDWAQDTLTKLKKEH